jgi:hypothetical protein
VIATADLVVLLTGDVATGVVGFAALIIAAASVTSFRAGRHTGRLFATHLGIGLEFLLAAGVIRLAGLDTFAMIGIAAAIIAVRRVIVLGLGYAARAAG